MTAYYNEIDPYAAQWLRNLIDAGHIAPGDVDERSIVDVRADLFGQEVAPASPSAQPARARRPMTSATCGPTGSGLSALHDRQSSLANRLKRRLDGAGSTLFTLTWAQKATPLGLPYFQLAASALRTSGSGCGSWLTPAANEFGADPETTLNRRARYAEKWGNNGFGLTLGQAAAAYAAWPTPMAGTPAQKGYNEAGSTDASRKVVALASWATPNTEDAKVGTSPRTSQPVALSRQAALASGPTATGSPAQTEKPGQLHPGHSRWVMGYETEHLNCAPTETPSILRSRRRSLKQA